jgi:hypothetical protein
MLAQLQNSNYRAPERQAGPAIHIRPFHSAGAVAILEHGPHYHSDAYPKKHACLSSSTISRNFSTDPTCGAGS